MRESRHYQHYEGILATPEDDLWLGLGPEGYGWYRVDRRGRLMPLIRGGGGIGLRNIREILLPVFEVSATVPPHAPAAAIVIARTVAPQAGRVKGLAVSVAAAATAGTGTDHKQQVRVRDAGFGGAGTTVVTNNAVIKDLNLTPDDLPAAGTIRSATGLHTTDNVIRKGRIVEVHHDESGTIGTGTRATFNLLGVVYEAAADIDLMRS